MSAREPGPTSAYAFLLDAPDVSAGGLVQLPLGARSAGPHAVGAYSRVGWRQWVESIGQGSVAYFQLHAGVDGTWHPGSPSGMPFGAGGHVGARLAVNQFAVSQDADVVMDADGTMARLPELIRFAQYHGMKIGAIADLIAYRRRFDRTIERVVETELHSRFGGDFRMVVFASTLEGTEHVALIKGDVAGDAPVMVRMHAVNILEDLLGDHHRQRGGGLQQAMEMIGRAERGVVVLIRENRSTTLSERITAELGVKSGRTGAPQLRDYGVGAQILLELGVRNLILLSNAPKRVIGIEGYGLNIIETRPVVRA